MNSVPQGSVLGPIMFIKYINDIDVGVNNSISKLADDAKIGDSQVDGSDRLHLQEDLRYISEGFETLEMPFNVNKCRILLVGTRNQKFHYEMNGVELECVECVKDVGVSIVLNFKFSQ